MSIQAQLKWIDGMQFIARAGDGPAVIIDNPESKGGASPMQLVLIGIAGCTAVDVISIMQKNVPMLPIFRSASPVNALKNIPSALRIFKSNMS